MYILTYNNSTLSKKRWMFNFNVLFSENDRATTETCWKL